MYTGSEHFILEGSQLKASLIDFWKWAYGDFVNNIHRSVLAEYIVALGLGIAHSQSEDCRVQWQPCDLITPEGLRIEVKSAAYVQSWDIRYPDHVSYRIAPAQLPDPVDGYVDGAPKQRNCDVYVFCLYKATSPDQNPLDLDLWEFSILKTSILDAERPYQKTITLPSLEKLDPVLCIFNDLPEGLHKAMAYGEQ